MKGGIKSEKFYRKNEDQIINNGLEEFREKDYDSDEVYPIFDSLLKMG
jgi:hypothetical protein